MAASQDSLRSARRFYSQVTVDEETGGFALRLDNRPPRSPGGRALIFPTRALAQLIADEWRAQGETIVHVSMPATCLAHTALDVVAGARDLSVDGVARFGTADLLCYFAEGPGSLVQRQETTWGPLLDWARQAHGLDFVRARGVVHVDQPASTLERLHDLLRPLDDLTLAGLAFAAALFGSAILALALRDGRIDANQAMAASRLDEIFQEERWGVDAEAAAKVDAMALEAVMVERWFRALA